MAAPAAAGIAGLLFSYNPALTNTQVEQALEASAAPVNFSLAYGRVDALAACSTSARRIRSLRQHRFRPRRLRSITN